MWKFPQPVALPLNLEPLNFERRKFYCGLIRSTAVFPHDAHGFYPLSFIFIPYPLRGGVGRALRRATKVARKTARMHGTPIYIWKNGKVVAEKP